jgi:hypothetical protein
MRTLSLHLPARAVLLAVALAALAVMVSAGAASAGTVVTHDSFVNAWGPVPSYDDCRGLPAVESGREVFAWQDELTPSGGLHEQGTDDARVQLDFEDGSYLVTYASFPWEFSFRPDAIGEVTKNFQNQGRGTLYDAAGNQIGTEWFHEVSHVSRIGYFDPGPNDILHVRFDKSWTTCSV